MLLEYERFCNVCCGTSQWKPEESIEKFGISSKAISAKVRALVK
jgi:hypothetical protein